MVSLNMPWFNSHLNVSYANTFSLILLAGHPLQLMEAPSEGDPLICKTGFEHGYNELFASLSSDHSRDLLRHVLSLGTI